MPSADINVTQGTSVGTNIFSGNTWNNFRNSTAGLFIDATPDATIGGTWSNAIVFFGSLKYYGRSLLMDFDLSGLPGGATITGLVIKLYGVSPSSTWSQGSVIFLEGTFGSTINTGDLDSFTGFTSGWDSSDVTEYSSGYGGGDWDVGSFNEITLNSDAVSAANTAFAAGNRFKMYGMEYDNWYSDSAVPGSNQGKQVNWIANPGASNEPVLVVTYSTGASGYGNTVSGIASANISSVNGIATANISKINGV
tara:strand:+ start:636 stop:1391 length:756 start_codon:yes stop_codon:yes gene_type:complete